MAYMPSPLIAYDGLPKRDLLLEIERVGEITCVVSDAQAYALRRVRNKYQRYIRAKREELHAIKVLIRAASLLLTQLSTDIRHR